MITVRPYTNKDEELWNQYVHGHPEGTLFHLTSWKHAVERSFSHKSFYAIAEKKDSQGRASIVGVLPLFALRSFIFGNYLISVPFAELGGPLADDSESEEKLIEYGAALCRTEKGDYLEVRSHRSVGKGLKMKSLYCNFSREIFPEVEDNLKAIPRKQRAMVRQGIKKELKTETGDHLLPTFYKLLARSYHNLGTPVFPEKFFKNLLQSHGENAQVMVVRSKEDVPVAGVLTFFYKDRILPYYAGSLREYRHLAPNDFMYWKLMEYGCQKEFKIFDFGRSKVGTGSYDFKRHWGFEPETLCYQYVLNKKDEMPNLSPANPKYKRKIQMWRSMPLFMTKLLGPKIARYLG